jgi:hypothetical protein
MSRTFMVLAVALWIPLTAHGEDLTKPQDGLLKRMSKQASDIENTLKDEKWRFTQRAAEDLDRRIGRIEQQLKTLPADHEAVKAELDHVAAIKKAIVDKFAAAGEAEKASTAAAEASANAEKKTLADAVAAKEQAAKAQSDSVGAVFTTPEFADDLRLAKAAVEMFKSASRFEFSHYLYARWPTHEIIAETRGWTESWSDTRSKLAALVAKYDAATKAKVRLDGKVEMARVDMKIALDDLRRGQPIFEKAIEAFAAGAPAQLDKWAADLKAEANKAVAASDYMSFIRPEGKIEQLRYRCANLVTVYKPLVAEAERAQLDAKVQGIEDDTEKTMAKLAEVIIRENLAPSEKYTRDDRKQLDGYVRGVWAKKFPKEEILSLRFAAATFERHTAWQFNPGANGMVKVDRSTLPVWVIVKDGPKQAIMWYATIVKQHMKGDTLELDWVPRPQKGAPPARRLLLSHL